MLAQKDDYVRYIVMTPCTDIDRNTDIEDELKRSVNNIGYLFDQRGVRFEHELYYFKNRRLHEQHMEIRRSLDNERDTFDPEVVFSTSANDLHQDHAYIGRETKRVFKEQNILAYEVPRATQNFNPDVFVPLIVSVINSNIDLIKIYATQNKQHYMREDLMMGTFHHRGRTIGVDFAQAFENVRLILPWRI